MRIATWNVNGLRARLDYITRWLEDRQPDVVGLQELKTPNELFPYDYFNELGYEALVHGQKSWNGVAILTKVHATLTGTGVANQDAFGSRLITANINDKVSFTTVYCPNGKNLEHADFAGKLGWYDDLTQQWQQLSDGPAHRIICGDFNIVPRAIDGWRGEAGEGSIFYTSGRTQSSADLDGHGPNGSVPAQVSRCPGIFLVGLSRRCLPSQTRSENRFYSGHQRTDRPYRRGNH